MPPCQQVALEPALAEVLAEDLDDAALGPLVDVGWQPLAEELAVRRLEDRSQPV
ncbi:hypothetical protein D3C83_246460 [compost metagenome]